MKLTFLQAFCEWNHCYMYGMTHFHSNQNLSYSVFSSFVLLQDYSEKVSNSPNSGRRVIVILIIFILSISSFIHSILQSVITISSLLCVCVFYRLTTVVIVHVAIIEIFSIELRRISHFFFLATKGFW